MADDTDILRDRARELARPVEPPPAPGTLLDVLEFKVAQERYAVEVVSVREVYPLAGLTRVPCTPPFVAGIVNVRGHMIPVIDFRKLFDVPEQGLADLHRVILLEGEGFVVGLLADAALAVRTIPTAALQASLETLTGIRGEYLKGVTPDRVVVLDAARLLADPKLVVREDVEG
jgi:purine-binding chemotaxis protein CheW